MATNADAHVTFQDRDAKIVRLLYQLGAATPQHVLTASRSWPINFSDLHTVRRRLRLLEGAGYIRSFPLATFLPESRRYYRLTRSGFQMLYPEAALPEDTFFRPIADSRQRHTFALADILAHTEVCSAAHRIRIAVFRREDEVTLEASGLAISPDHFLQLETSGRLFNLFLEVDRGTEPIESDGANSVRRKLRAYEAYQDLALAEWRFRFRVLFVTTSMERVHGILVAAQKVAKNTRRGLIYATTFDAFLGDSDALRSPFVLDHHGRFQSLINPNPTAPPPIAVRLAASFENELPI